jgi:hypothetical protein
MIKINLAKSAETLAQRNEPNQSSLELQIDITLLIQLVISLLFFGAFSAQAAQESECKQNGGPLPCIDGQAGSYVYRFTNVNFPTEAAAIADLEARYNAGCGNGIYNNTGTWAVLPPAIHPQCGTVFEVPSISDEFDVEYRNYKYSTVTYFVRTNNGLCNQQEANSCLTRIRNLGCPAGYVPTFVSHCVPTGAIPFKNVGKPNLCARNPINITNKKLQWSV